ncbi:MAG: glutamyl-tRNA reductase [Planctomycetota bacterium]|nr:glutamyl-tRNA reductase [Planctomycetota bacterium]
MKISSLTLSHSNFPIEIREKIAINREQAVGILSDLRFKMAIENALLISTCNRTELFLATEKQERGQEILEEILKQWMHERQFSIPGEVDELILQHHESITRLLRVASGLESQLLGESEILGQIRIAIELSEETQVAGSVIRKLWEKALRCGKRVRSETSIGDGALSLAYGALKVAKKIHGKVSGLHYCIIGAGEVAELVLRHLQEIEGAKITILNRSEEHAEHLASMFGAEPGSLEDLPSVLVNTDVLISSTASAHPIIKTDLIRKVLEGRPKGLLLVDLGVPRDIDPAVKELPQVFLYNLDDLARLIQENLTSRQEAIPGAEEIVEHERQQFQVWIVNQQLQPAILSLRKSLEDASEQELDLLRDELDAETHQQLTVLVRKLLKRALHRPTKEFRATSSQWSESFVSRIESLFKQETFEDEEQK